MTLSNVALTSKKTIAGILLFLMLVLAERRPAMNKVGYVV